MSAAIPIRAFEQPSLRTLALEALEADRAVNRAPDSKWNDANSRAYDAAENFRAALRVMTGIDCELWGRLQTEGILP